MEPLLSLPVDQFRAALAELQLDPQREAELVRQYQAANGSQRGAGGRGALYNLLDNIIGYDDDVVTPGERLGAGVEGFSQGLLSDPLGTASDIISGGYETIEGAMAPGATPMDVLGAAGIAMGAGGIVTGPRGALRSGLLRDADSETPAQRVARLLREGRADEVTDDLMAQADPQEMYRLYEAGQTGADMPMDQASRMARAQEMGFDTGTPLYHGGLNDIDAFRAAPGSKTDHGWYGEGAYFGDADTASIYAMNHPTINRPEGGNVIESVGRGQIYEWPEGRPAALDANEARAISQEMTQSGYAGANVYAPNDPEVWGDAAGSFRERVIYDPTNIRSRFARFDPRLSHLSNLNAANVSPITGAAAMSASQQNDPLANLRAYIAAAGGVLGR